MKMPDFNSALYFKLGVSTFHIQIVHSIGIFTAEGICFFSSQTARDLPRERPHSGKKALIVATSASMELRLFHCHGSTIENSERLRSKIWRSFNTGCRFAEFQELDNEMHRHGQKGKEQSSKGTAFVLSV